MSFCVLNNDSDCVLNDPSWEIILIIRLFLFPALEFMWVQIICVCVDVCVRKKILWMSRQRLRLKRNRPERFITNSNCCLGSGSTFYMTDSPCLPFWTGNTQKNLPANSFHCCVHTCESLELKHHNQFNQKLNSISNP